MGRYDDIIGHKYEGSTTHQRMSLANRAAQFAPFAALTGHDAAISETARLTDEKIELSTDEQLNLSRQLQMALDRLDGQSVMTFTVFQNDNLKSGGRYLTISGVIKKYDEYSRTLHLTDGQTIDIDQLLHIDSPTLDNQP